MSVQLSQYEFDSLADLLGSGAFGDIYRAYDKVLRRKVALKISRPTAPGDDRYSIPSEVLRIMDYRHENLVNYFYAFETEGTDDIGKKIKRQVAVMEFIEGKDLHKMIVNKEIGHDYEKIKEISLGILKGLHFLHAHRIIHRDLKPSNIMIFKKDGQDIPKITDFGISKEFDTNTNVSLSAVVGTFAYMAPEQFGERNAEGRNDTSRTKIDFRLDIWAFGVILFEMFRGFPPFGNEKTNTTGEIISNIIQAAIHNEINAIEEPFHSIIKKCLCINRENRYQNTEEIIEVLNEYEENIFWDKIIGSDTREDYSKYLLTYPAGKHIKEAEKRISLIIEKEQIEIRRKEEETAWLRCLDKANIANFQEYFNAYPESPHRNDAREKVELLLKNQAEELREKAETDLWVKTVRIDTKSAYEKYLLENNGGKYAREAKDRILNLDRKEHTVLLEENEESEWEKIKDQNQKHLFEEYIRKFPEGKYKAKAVEEIAKIIKEVELKHFSEGRFDELPWNYLEDRITFGMGKKYLKDYPNGRHIKKIQQNIRRTSARWKYSVTFSVLILFALVFFSIYQIVFINRSTPDEIMFRKIQNSNNTDDYISFLRTYPKSVYMVPVSRKIYFICDSLISRGSYLFQQSTALSSDNIEKTQALLLALSSFDKASAINEFSIYPFFTSISNGVKKCMNSLEAIRKDITTSINYSKQEYGADWDATEYLKILTTIQQDSLFIKWNENWIIRKPKWAS